METACRQITKIEKPERRLKTRWLDGPDDDGTGKEDGGEPSLTTPDDGTNLRKRNKKLNMYHGTYMYVSGHQLQAGQHGCVNK